MRHTSAGDAMLATEEGQGGEEAEDAYVELGVPGKEGGKQSQLPQGEDVRRSWIGGRARWMEEEGSRETSLTCELCGKSLWLVAQIYAPTASLHRSVCVFGCNSPDCSRQAKGWRAMRTQQHRPAAPHSTPSSSSVQPDASSEVKVEYSSWGEEEGDLDASLAALLLQNERGSSSVDQKRRVKEKRSSSTGENISDSVGETVTATGEHVGPELPFFELHFQPEPYGAIAGAAELDRTMLDRLRRYKEEEEDESISGMIDATILGSAVPQQSSLGTSVDNRDENYEKTPAHLKAVMKFEERVSRCPRQVVRYVWGGKPLWSSSSFSREVHPIPACVCGAERTFEFQLMPAILHHLRVDDFGHDSRELRGTLPAKADDSNHHSKSALSEPIICRAGMEWGAIGIWSCPNACALSNQEFVVVQPEPS